MVPKSAIWEAWGSILVAWGTVSRSLGASGTLLGTPGGAGVGFYRFGVDFGVPVGRQFGDFWVTFS